MIPFFLRNQLLKFVDKRKWEYYFSLSLLNNDFKSLLSVDKIFNEKNAAEGRKKIRKYLMDQNKTNKILFIEFGVWKGQFTNLVSESNTNSSTRVFGFDSFLGLPEAWHKHKIGTFSTKGETPKVKDPRVKYVKGWFQNTVRDSLKEIEFNNFDEIIVSFDADLYSSTLFCLVELNNFVDEYTALFDEFSPDECRALYDYTQAYSADLDFIARSDFCNQPNQVICKIKTCKKFDPITK